MKEFKGTKNWQISPNPFCITGDDGIIILEVNAFKGGNWQQVTDEAKANVNIANAAPDLLEALQNIMEAMRTGSWNGDKERNDARAAINKALKDDKN